MTWSLLTGDVRTVLATLDPESVQTCVTSPPYWGLRDYGTATWDGGDPECDHKQGRDGAGRADGIVDERSQRNRDGAAALTRKVCPCGATRIDSQIGLEPTPEEYVANLVAVFREVRRVLRGDGSLWLNLGDSYASAPKGNPEALSAGLTNNGRNAQQANVHRTRSTIVSGLKPKDLVGIPWAAAFALRADGWYLRSDIIWAKPNPMPESVTDRPTKAHEYLFLLTKSPRYFYDADAIREASLDPEDDLRRMRGDRNGGYSQEAQEKRKAGVFRGDEPSLERLQMGRNKRSVWTVSTQPFPGAHFATFPPKLIEPCILAGSPPKCCGECGAPWERVVERTSMVVRPTEKRANWQADDDHARTQLGGTMLEPASTQTVGWQPTCTHDDDSGQALVLDPFAGAGTTLLVAEQQGRDSVGIELNPDYAQLARDRLANWDVNRNGYLTGDPEPLPGQGSLL